MHLSLHLSLGGPSAGPYLSAFVFCSVSGKTALSSASSITENLKAGVEIFLRDADIDLQLRQRVFRPPQGVKTAGCRTT